MSSPGLCYHDLAQLLADAPATWWCIICGCTWPDDVPVEMVPPREVVFRVEGFLTRSNEIAELDAMWNA